MVRLICQTKDVLITRNGHRVRAVIQRDVPTVEEAVALADFWALDEKLLPSSLLLSVEGRTEAEVTDYAVAK